ncbi:Stress-activated map kinase-interacting protein 1 homolog [Caenorhabditis elegans]|uniref:Stress-activated map kinase-interacting protein 1 homolog n=1 Tax=Caenorhabditis elegans TaxID=6239 RepID=SIN1_CAEEL|nr:Stress-activated map kinase-interacting protein 1 homolog [Caenorhabditis elegans]Q9NA80.3 RecName: Full=Stress-activated map kinase-interacting protein 1 homolog [Caenorhabditis elegans]CAB55023.3 Stress-activated map kinase-interacting protein 1 homolog [Caenorhabditis elegans]|eukprot:NP_496596.3 Stress-activated map kinase-interacting protein 1 homolog [Caenorhabditis elegans]
MGHVDREDLLNVIRHELRLEDDDGPGLCSRLLLNPDRKCRAGGLPLDFRLKNGDLMDDGDAGFDDIYEIPLYEEPIHTRTLINDSLALRTAEKIKEEGRRDNFYTGPLDELFVKQEVNWPPKTPISTEKSAIERYLEENSANLNNPLGEYSKFAATTTDPSRQIEIIIPMSCDEEIGFKTLKIEVLTTARIREVIGYCLLQYYLTFDSYLPGEVDDYQFYLAEEDGEIEHELPPLDSSKLVGQVGFTCLGLVSRIKKNGNSRQKRAVAVWFVDKDQYVIEVDNMEKPLRWLRDEAFRLREETVKEREPLFQGLLDIKEYYMEAVDNFDVKLDLEASISSARSLEFVMIRKNSSRAGFHPRGGRYGRQMSAMLTLKMPNSPIAAGPMTPLPTVMEESPAVAGTSNGFGFPKAESCGAIASTPGVTWNDDGGQLSSFIVQRIHKFKPKWKANLIFRWTCFEIEKYREDRSAFLPQGYQKHTKVPWEYVGGVRTQLKDAKAGRVDMWQITFFWLPVLSDETVKDVIGDAEWNLNLVAKIYANEEKWRSVTLETFFKQDVDEIFSQTNSILQARDASIYKAFSHSSFGTLSPAASADLALMESAEAIVSPSSDAPSRSSNGKNGGKFRKMSSLMASVMGRRKSDSK